MQTMNKYKLITRRDALKRIATLFMGTAVVSPGLLSLISCGKQEKHSIIFYFTGTGNCLYIARQLAGEGSGTELLSIPQLVKQGKYDFEADEIGIVYPIYGHMPPYMVRQFIQKAKLKAVCRADIRCPQVRLRGDMGRHHAACGQRFRLHRHADDGG